MLTCTHIYVRHHGNTYQRFFLGLVEGWICQKASLSKCGTACTLCGCPSFDNALRLGDLTCLTTLARTDLFQPTTHVATSLSILSILLVTCLFANSIPMCQRLVILILFCKAKGGIVGPAVAYIPRPRVLWLGFDCCARERKWVAAASLKSCFQQNDGNQRGAVISDSNTYSGVRTTSPNKQTNTRV